MCVCLCVCVFPHRPDLHVIQIYVQFPDVDLDLQSSSTPLFTIFGWRHLLLSFKMIGMTVYRIICRFRSVHVREICTELFTRHTVWYINAYYVKYFSLVYARIHRTLMGYSIVLCYTEEQNITPR